MLFAFGAMAILMGLPQLRWFLVGSLLCATVLACVLIAWRRSRRSAQATRLSTC
jgi:Flp pilus assembly protein protease CpaA